MVDGQLIEMSRGQTETQSVNTDQTEKIRSESKPSRYEQINFYYHHMQRVRERSKSDCISLAAQPTANDRRQQNKRERENINTKINLEVYQHMNRHHQSKRTHTRTYTRL